MFGTMGLSELIIILVIVFIIFGAGRLPQIGEGVGKALKGFRKEVNEVPQPASNETQEETVQPQVIRNPTTATVTVQPPPAGPSSVTPRPNAPYVQGPEMTPGTTASLLYAATSQTPQPSTPLPHQATAPGLAISMEERAAAPAPLARASYPPLPPGSQAKPTAKRPSAIVNKDAVARVQAQQAALKAKSTPSPAGVSPKDMQHLGEGIGDVVRTFRQAVNDVRSSVDPQMHTIRTEMDAAQKELQQSIEAAKSVSSVEDTSPTSS